MRHIADRFTAILDANVLYPFLIRDVLLCFAEAGFYRVMWTEDITREWSSHLTENMPGHKSRIERTVALMNEAFPEAEVHGYKDLIPSIKLPDPKDRHVVAAAIVGGAAVIVTQNQKHFPPELMAEYDIELRTPDEFLLDAFQLYQLDAIAVLKRMRAEYKAPPMSAEEFIFALIDKGLVLLGAELKQHAALL